MAHTFYEVLLSRLLREKEERRDRGSTWQQLSEMKMHSSLTFFTSSQLCRGGTMKSQKSHQITSSRSLLGNTRQKVRSTNKIKDSRVMINTTFEPFLGLNYLRVRNCLGLNWDPCPRIIILGECFKTLLQNYTIKSSIVGEPFEGVLDEGMRPGSSGLKRKCV